MSNTKITVMATIIGAMVLGVGDGGAELRPRCVRVLLAAQARHGRCHAACERRAAARTSFDPEPCEAHCTASYEASAARIEAAARCRSDDTLAFQPKFLAGEIVQPSPIFSSNGMCLDVRNGSSANRTPVQLYPCNGTPAQDWSIGGNFIRGLAGKCLDMPYAAVGGAVWLFDCWGGSNQRWTLSRAAVRSYYGGLGSMFPTGPGSGAAVQVLQNYTYNQWAYTANNEFRLPDGRCLQLGWAGGAMAATCNGSVYQKWVLGRPNEGIKWAPDPSYCLSRLDSTSQTASLTIAPCSPGAARQRFLIAMQIRGMGDMCLASPRGAQAWTPASLERCDTYYAYPPATQSWYIRL